MRVRTKAIWAGLMVSASAGVFGCSTHSDGGYYAEPAPAGYVVVDDPYYGQGAYAGDYWVWHDREGHEHREARAAHEQRGREFQQRRAEQPERRDVRPNAERDNRTQNGSNGYRGAEGQSTAHPEANRSGPAARPGAAGHGGEPSGQAHAGEGHAGAGEAEGHAEGENGHR